MISRVTAKINLQTKMSTQLTISVLGRNTFDEELGGISLELEELVLELKLTLRFVRLTLSNVDRITATGEKIQLQT